MPKTYILYFLTVFCVQLQSQISQQQLELSIKNGIDPYFVESTDTISENGPKCIVRSLIQDRNGNFWLASWQGIIKYDGKKFINYTLKNGLIKFHVFSAFEDSKGNIWFSTVRGGIYRYDPLEDSKGKKAFTLFTTADGLADNTSDCIREDKKGNIWLSGKGLTCYDGKSFKKFGAADGLSSDQVNALLIDKSGKIWAGGSNGIEVYDQETKKFTAILNERGQAFGRVASLFEDKTGNIWTGTFNGLFRFQPAANKKTKAQTDSLAPRLVMYICQDHLGNIWFAYNAPKQPGKLVFTLFRYDTAGKIEKILEQTDSSGFPQIFGIIEDKEGNIWYGSSSGAYRFKIDGLSNACVRGSCNHQGSMREAILEHEKEKARFLTNFTR